MAKSRRARKEGAEKLCPKCGRNLLPSSIRKRYLHCPRCARQPSNPTKIAERFWAKVNRQSPTECWIWRGFIDGGGYGQFNHSGSMLKAHRLAYELSVGQIPSGLVLDHLCRCRSCVNPSHLEPVHHLVNVRRGEAGKLQRGRTECPKGHPYDEENTYISKRGLRSCRQCGKERMRICRAERRGTDHSAGLHR